MNIVKSVVRSCLERIHPSGVRYRPAHFGEGEVWEVEVLAGEFVSESLPLIVGYRLDWNPEGAQLVLVALEHSHQRGVCFFLARVGGDVASELVERRRVAADQESGEEIDPPLELGGSSGHKGKLDWASDNSDYRPRMESSRPTEERVSVLTPRNVCLSSTPDDLNVSGLGPSFVSNRSFCTSSVGTRRRNFMGVHSLSIAMR